jgi:hypothetical protein
MPLEYPDEIGFNGLSMLARQRLQCLVEFRIQPERDVHWRRRLLADFRQTALQVGALFRHD